MKSKDGSKNLGCYGTREEAVKRLGQVEYFKRHDSTIECRDAFMRYYAHRVLGDVATTMRLVDAARAVLRTRGIHVDGESDVYCGERFFQWALGQYRKDAGGMMPSESMGAGIGQDELEQICRKQKTEWSNGNPVTEGQRLSACAAWKRGK